MSQILEISIWKNIRHPDCTPTKLAPLFSLPEPTMDAREVIQKTITDNPVVLFMKGTAQFPQCGFSGRALQALKACGAKNVVTINVLEDEGVRQGIKDYANWPTIPQLYVGGEFVGGSDILAEMQQSGELKALLQKVNAAE